MCKFIPKYIGKNVELRKMFLKWFGGQATTVNYTRSTCYKYYRNSECVLPRKLKKTQKQPLLSPIYINFSANNKTVINLQRISQQPGYVSVKRKI